MCTRTINHRLVRMLRTEFPVMLTKDLRCVMLNCRIPHWPFVSQTSDSQEQDQQDSQGKLAAQAERGFCSRSVCSIFERLQEHIYLNLRLPLCCLMRGVWRTRGVNPINPAKRTRLPRRDLNLVAWQPRHQSFVTSDAKPQSQPTAASQPSSSESGPIRATPSMWRCSRIMHMQRDLHPTLLSSLEGIVDQMVWFRENWHEEVRNPGVLLFIGNTPFKMLIFPLAIILLEWSKMQLVSWFTSRFLLGGRFCWENAHVIIS